MRVETCQRNRIQHEADAPAASWRITYYSRECQSQSGTWSIHKKTCDKKAIKYVDEEDGYRYPISDCTLCKDETFWHEAVPCLHTRLEFGFVTQRAIGPQTKHDKGFVKTDEDKVMCTKTK